MATRNILPNADGEGSLGTPTKRWGVGYFENLDATSLQGFTPSEFSKGSWDAENNTPTLTNAVGNIGDYYVVTVGGTRSDLEGVSTTYNVGDWVVYEDEHWKRYSPYDISSTVAGLLPKSGGVMTGQLKLSTGIGIASISGVDIVRTDYDGDYPVFGGTSTGTVTLGGHLDTQVVVHPGTEISLDINDSQKLRILSDSVIFGASANMGGNDITALQSLNTHAIPGGTDTLALVSDITGNTGRHQGSGYKLLDTAIVSSSASSYTLSDADNGRIVTLSNSSTVTVTVPSGLGKGFSCQLFQGGPGQIQLSPSSTTLHSYGSLTKTAGQYASIGVVSVQTDVFYLNGALA